MITIHKYQLNCQDDTILSMPSGARFLDVQVESDVPCVWCLLDDTQPLSDYRLRFVATGWNCDWMDDAGYNYIGTVQVNGVFHLFLEVVPIAFHKPDTVEAEKNNAPALLKVISHTAVCRSCRAVIYWVTTKNGKSSPYDPDGVSHFATCPSADSHRKG